MKIYRRALCAIALAALAFTPLLTSAEPDTPQFTWQEVHDACNAGFEGPAIGDCIVAICDRYGCSGDPLFGDP